MLDQELLPYKSILIQIFTALDYSESEFEDLMLMFYLGLIGRYFESEFEKIKNLESRLEGILDQNLSDEEFLLEFRKLILDENNLKDFNRVFKRFTGEYLDSFYEDLDDKGKLMIDKLVNEYKIKRI